MRLLSYGVVSVQKKVKTGLVTDLNLIKANLSCKQHCKFWIFHVNKGQLISFLLFFFLEELKTTKSPLA